MQYMYTLLIGITEEQIEYKCLLKCLLKIMTLNDGYF